MNLEQWQGSSGGGRGCGGVAVTMTGRALIALNGRRQTHFTLVFGVLRGKVGGVNHSCFLRHGHARQQTGTVTRGAASRALLSTPLLSFVLSLTLSTTNPNPQIYFKKMFAVARSRLLNWSPQRGGSAGTAVLYRMSTNIDSAYRPAH